MIAVDTNVLVYAHRAEFEQHGVAAGELRALAEGRAAWALPVFVLAEFLRVVTHLRVLRPPSEERQSVATLDALLASPSVRVLRPGDGYWPILRDLVAAGSARGNAVHDASIAALCLEAGVSRILTEDRDFDRFEGIEARRLGQA